MRLLPLQAFAEVFEPLQGKRIGFVRPLGNVGDELIHTATFQLLDAFGIDWKIIDPAGDADVEHIVFGGGGNMGTLYRNNWQLRSQVLRLGLPVTILPQSFTSQEDRPYARVYVRERASLKYAPQATLAPDLALGLDLAGRTAPSRGVGVFVRKDQERTVARPWLSRDPVRLCRTPLEYLRLAAAYRHVVTDRLHFAICGLLAGRRVTLLPNSYHKNRSMYETWLQGLGCEFAWSVEESLAGVRPCVEMLGGALCRAA
jgi:exopolysaccharide biosynthesis predicted pyruvyltransferase EpsI